ncbi:phosphatidylglycerol lysyltransferase domain-containing protein [Corynebacterium mycetoides]|uniref:phosphatidylglycerol lysyltransferase domain-containing protein n=1 Tax=Corynebacterium mycetoides TaxID=38302 RepID=UPI0038B3201C
MVCYTLDFMRRDTAGFRPTVEFLLAEAAAVAADQELKWVSLSRAPLAHSDEPDSLLEVLLDRAGARIEPLYGFRSLAASKYKFHPTHSGWYLAYVVREFLVQSGSQSGDRGGAPSPALAPTDRP